MPAGGAGLRVMTSRRTVRGRLVLDDRIATGTIEIADGVIVSVDLGSDVVGDSSFIAPGFVDIHVHGGGGHDAMGGQGALDGMARHLLRHGVTSFLPTAVSAPMAALAEFADRVRAWMPLAPADGAAPLGFNLEGPFLAPSRHGAHDPAVLRTPAEVGEDELALLHEDLRVITIAPELRGALALIARLRERGIVVSIGHSAATLAEARAGIAAGATSTTHLFNAMTGVDHHEPGLAVAALVDDRLWVELIADGEHVHPALWPIVARTKPEGRVVLVSDGIPMAGLGDGRGTIGGLAIEVVAARATLLGTATLAGSVIALDSAVRNLVAAGFALPFAVAAASRNPLALLGVTDRGRLAPGQRADLVELDGGLGVRRVMRAGTWSAGVAG